MPNTWHSVSFTRSILQVNGASQGQNLGNAATGFHSSRSCQIRSCQSWSCWVMSPSHLAHADTMGQQQASAKGSDHPGSSREGQTSRQGNPSSSWLTRDWGNGIAEHLQAGPSLLLALGLKAASRLCRALTTPVSLRRSPGRESPQAELHAMCIPSQSMGKRSPMTTLASGPLSEHKWCCVQLWKGLPGVGLAPLGPVAAAEWRFSRMLSRWVTKALPKDRSVVFCP